MIDFRDLAISARNTHGTRVHENTRVCVQRDSRENVHRQDAPDETASRRGGGRFADLNFQCFKWECSDSSSSVSNSDVIVLSLSLCNLVVILRHYYVPVFRGVLDG